MEYVSQVGSQLTMLFRIRTLCIYFTIYSQAEVKWVIRLQFVLLVVLLLGAGDFAIGSFTHSDPGPIKSDNNELYKDVYLSTRYCVSWVRTTPNTKFII